MKRLLYIGVGIGLVIGCVGCDSETSSTNESRRIQVNQETLKEDDSFAPIEPLFWTVDIYGSPADYEAGLSPFTRSQRLLFAIHWYRSEVNNGGHDQFYYNSTGIVWRDALAGFDFLGLSEFASVLRESADRLGGAPSLDREERQAALERIAPNFDDLDNRFYELEKTADLDKKMLDFIRNHVQEFLFDGVVEMP